MKKKRADRIANSLQTRKGIQRALSVNPTRANGQWIVMVWHAGVTFIFHDDEETVESVLGSILLEGLK